MIIIILSTLPYFHEFITTENGLRPWVQIYGIENFLTDDTGSVHGFSTYRVFLYTLLIFVFASIGWTGWYTSAKEKYYKNALLLAAISGIYHVVLIVFNLRKTQLNESTPKLLFIALLFIIFGYLSFKKVGISVRKILVWLSFFFMAILPFYHDVITESGVGVRSWVPIVGIESMLTDSEGYVRGLGSYRVLVYLFCIYLFSHLGWLGWFMDSRGRRFRPFLLIPAALSLYQVILIVMSWRETELSSPSVNLVITIVLSVLLAINFFYNNKFFAETETITKNTTTIKSNNNEN